VNCPAVYTFLLNNDHIMIINGVECITWAHGLDIELKHDYFGTEAVVRDLMMLEGWSEGCINIDDSFIVKNPKTKQVINIVKPEPQIAAIWWLKFDHDCFFIIIP